jgi:hypothetical protein
VPPADAVVDQATLRAVTTAAYDGALVSSIAEALTDGLAAGPLGRLADDTRIKVRFDDPYVADPDVLQLWRLHVVDGGVLRVPSGRLGIADPGYDLRGRAGHSDLGEVQIPPGSHPVQVTQAAISRRDHGSPVLDTRTAYVSVLLGAGAEVRRRKLALVPRGEAPPPLEDDEFIGFGVDGGRACLVDAEAAQRSYPNVDAWFVRFHPETRAWWGDPPEEDGDWFDALYGPLGSQPQPGEEPRAVVNLALPHAPEGENVVAVNSGWGDGYYAVVGGYDANGRLAVVHVDFFLIPDPPGSSRVMASVEPE